MGCTKAINLPGLFMFIDFEKAFHKLRVCLSQEMFGAIQIWAKFRKMVKAFYKESDLPIDCC